jgi:hypothetical protein
MGTRCGMSGWLVNGKGSGVQSLNSTTQCIGRVPARDRDLTLVLAHAMASRLRAGYRLAESERA